MTIIIGGHGLGLQDVSLGLLNRNDLTSNGTLDQRMQAYANVSGGNLVIQERDAFLPSRGEDFQLVRIYNSLGKLSGGADWSWSTSVSLSSHNDNLAGQSGNVEAYLLRYGDGTTLHFDFDASRNLWVATDGAGAYETLKAVKNPPNGQPAFTVTRADQTQLLFDTSSRLTAIVDSNGVRTDFDYQFGRVIQVRDDTGHVLNYQYSGSDLVRIVDEQNVTLVQYGYSAGQLTSVTDRFGHVTTYTYVNGLLAAIDLPNSQVVNGQVQTFEPRRISFAYQTLAWKDKSHVTLPLDNGPLIALTEIVDPLGGKTTFDYSFGFGGSMSAADRDARYHVGGSSYFTGGSTRVVDALGNARASSNTAEYVAWRQANGFYASYNAATVAASPALTAQYNAIRNAQSIVYSYDADGYLTQVVDQQGLQTSYSYGGKSAGDAQSVINQDNLLSIVDRNGWGATTSDSAYFRALRKDLGVVDLAGNGKPVADLTAAEKTALLAKFTTSFTYDANGNLISRTDNAGNLTTYTYTAFNKVASETAAMGNALASSDEAIYQQKRTELGFPASVGSLTQPQTDALKALYTTSYSYDAKQNLIERKDPGGDLTRFEYDAFGNLTRKIIFLDPSDLVAPAKQQVTQYFYDGFGNNVETVDGEGAHTFRTFDQFGNVLTWIDGRGGVTTNTYDADNRLLTTTDPEGHTIVNAFDAVGNKISITDTNGHTVTQVFDRNNLLIATIDPAVSAALTRTTIFNYDILGNNTEMTDAEGRKHTYTFDSRRLLLDVATPEVLNGAEVEALVSYHTTYAYDGEGNIVTLTENNGNVTQLVYTSNGLVKRQTSPIGQVTEYLYDANLQQLHVIIGAQLEPALRRSIRFGYDEENHLISETDAEGGIIRYEYDAAGNLNQLSDKNGNTSNFEFDRNNRLLKEIRPSVTDPVTGQPTRYTVLHKYDANGNQIETTDERGNVTKVSFDKDNRQVMVTDSNNTNTLFSYDSRDNITQIAIGAELDATGKPILDDAEVTSFQYDEFNQLIAKTDAMANALIHSDAALYQRLRTERGLPALKASLTDAQKIAIRNAFTQRAEYDRVGNQVKRTDNLGRVTVSEYDALNRLQKETEAVGLPEARSTQTRYNGNAEVVKSTDALGRVTHFEYDAADRLTGTTDALGFVTHTEYDTFANVTAVTHASGTPQSRTTRYVYDRNDRLLQETDPEGHITRYEYDAVGNRVKVTDGRGGVNQFVYDALNRNVRIIDPLGLQTRYEYDGIGNRIALIDARGGIQRFVYDPDNRYVETTDAQGRVTRLEYNKPGDIITQTTAFNTPQAQTTRFVYDAQGNLRQTTDAKGNVQTRGYDDVYNLTSSTDGNGHLTTYGFDAFNRQIRITDPLGGRKTFSYDAADNKLSETDASGRTRTFQYDAGNQLIVETDASNVETRYAYDAVGNQISITRAANTAQAATVRFDYHKDGLLIRETDALGNEKSYSYDANHNVTKITDANNHATSYEYEAANRNTRIVDPLGHVTQMVYDGNGNRIQVIDANSHAVTSYFNADNEAVLTVDAEGFATSRAYDANGNPVRETLFKTKLAAVDPTVLPTLATSAEDQTIAYDYDELNRLVKRTDALGGVRLYSYDAVGNQLSETDENNHTTRLAYDENNRLTHRTDALGGVRSYAYDAVGNQLSETDENNHATHFAYDVNNRLTSRTDALGGIHRFAYDAVGNQISEVDETGNTTRFAYDANNRLVSRTTGLEGIRRFAYDAVGNQISETDEKGNTSTLAYDADDRLIRRTDALGGARSFTYDAADNQVTETDENGKITSLAYDANNRLVRQTDPLGTQRDFTYDAAGNQVTEIDENGRTTSLAYDQNNRLTRRTDPLGGVRAFAYDAGGNVLVDTDENGHATRFAYDALNRITSSDDALGFRTRFRYDNVGNLLESAQQLSLTDPDQIAIQRSAYDALNRLKASLSAEGYLALYDYDAVGRQIRLTEFDDRLVATADGGAPTSGSGPSRVTEASYDANGRLITETSALGVVTRYEYDAAGNRTARIEADATAAARRTEIHFDAANRIFETIDALGVVTHTVRDAAGNALEVREAFGTPAERVTRFQYDGNNRVSTETDALGIVTEHAYDAVGNLVATKRALGLPDERTARFEYDANRRQIAQINGESERTEYVYDGVGNRTQLTVAPGLPEQRVNRFRYDADNRLIAEVDGNGVETRYRYDGAGNKLEITQLAAAYNGAGNPVTSYQGTPIAGQERHTLFTYDLDNRIVTVVDPLGGETRHEYDALGNQTRITDATGVVTENAFDAEGRLVRNLVSGGEHGGVLVSNEYDEFGNVTRTQRGFADGADTRQTDYTYDKLDRQTAITEFDKVEQLTGSTVFSQAFSTVVDYDAFGNQTRLAYGTYLLGPDDPEYDAAKAARAHPLTAIFSYDALDRLASTTDGAGNKTAYQSDSHGNRVSQTTGAETADARTVRYSYDKADRLTRRETGDGGLVKLAYDETGNQISKQTLQSGLENGTGANAPVWATQGFGYDGNGRVIEETDALGVLTRHALDAFGNEVETRIAAGTPDERVLKSEYNKNNDLTAQTDALGFRSTFQVDKLGNRIVQTDALGRVTRLYYNERNEQIGTLDPEGFLTAFGRDSAGNITATRVYINRYAAPANPLIAPAPEAEDPVRSTLYAYDNANNRMRETAADGAVTQYSYDSARNLVQTTQLGSSDPELLSRTADPSPHVQTFEYDAAGRLVEFINVDGTVESYAYDTANNKILESVTNPNPLPGGRTDPARITRFEYDAANRLIKQSFDPDGLNLVETLAYDKAGNVVRKADANGNATTSKYDLGNRLVGVTDALAHTTTFAYDRVGNRTALTDALGNTAQFEYDKNDRLVKEIQPAVDVFTVAGGLSEDVRPTILRSYDAAGNLVQVIDANGFKTTSYYDRNNNKVAEINGDNVLRTFAYDATGALTSATLYMTRVAASANDPAQLPAPPAGEARTIRSFYDAAGRLVRTEYPQIDVTTLTAADTDNPTAATAKVTPEERHFYDAFGNRVESTDRRGNHSLAYFDKLGRAVATIDAGGYLTETDYDDQGNVVQQRKYAQALDLAGIVADERPARPTGDVSVVDRIFDTASRLTEEISPPVKVGESNGADALERVRTVFAYDANGNQINRMLAAGTTEAATERSYYDAANRRVAVVTAGGTLNTFAYDANGNRTAQSRFIKRVPETVDLSSASLADIRAAVPATPAQDETTLYSYDALNRLVTQEDVMIEAGETTNNPDNDITVQSVYDASGNFTQRVDAVGNRSTLAYDALGHITQTLTPNGAASFIEYDAAGMKLRAWTGGLPNQSAQQAANISASASGGLTISWAQPGADAQSWVVWDADPQDVPDGSTPSEAYANESAHVGSGAVSVSIAAPANTQLYFRIVSQDSAGNLAWTEERSATIPPGIDSLSVAQTGDGLQVRVRFNSAVDDPVLKFGPAGGTLGSSVTFTAQDDGSYTALIANPSDPQSLAFQLEWQSGGETFSSAAIPFEAGGEHTAVGPIVGIAVPVSGDAQVGNGQLVLVDGVRHEDAKRINDQLQFDPQLATNGAHRYDVFFGTLANANHTVTLTSHAQQSSVQNGEDTINTDGQGDTTSVVRHMAWEQTYETHVEVTLGAGETPTGAVHAAFKTAGSGIEFTDDVALTLTDGAYTRTLALDPGDYDVKVYYTNADGREVIVEWRRITVAEATLPAAFDVTDDTAPFDFAGQEDELDLTAEVDDPAGARSFSGRSLEVLASETDGAIDRQGASALAVDAGLYAGPLESADSASAVALETTDSSGPGSQSTDGLRSLTYYTQIRYNALGHKIATNEDSGVWRTLGVDANGNAVATRLYGTQADEAADLAGTPGHEPNVSLAAFDALDREIATFQVATAVQGLTGLHRAVTRTSYDYAGRVVAVLDPGDSAPYQSRYDGNGNLIASIDPLGNVTRRFYNGRGDLKTQIDPSGHTKSSAYDSAGNIVAETDEIGNTTTHDYDAFGRRTKTSDPLNHATTMTYDQRDRLVTVTDALGNATTRYYDKRDNEIWLRDANGHWFGKGYDAMGRLAHEYSFLDASPANLAEAQAALDPANGLHDELIDVASTYDVFGNKSIKTDANGRREIFAYGAFARVTRRSVEDVTFTGTGAAPIAFDSTTAYDRFGGVILQTSTQGQNITRKYDAVGRLVEINDAATGAKTTYTYGLNGQRARESITVNGSLERDITYSYDDNDRMVRWADAVTGEHLDYDFDASGNLAEVFTDDRSLVHSYTYNADGRVASFDKGEGLNTFEYDDAGNRITWDEAGTISRYRYDDADRVTEHTDDSGEVLQSWDYDAVGNITRHVQAGITSTNRFLANNLIDQSVRGDQTTTTAFDKTGRTLSQSVVSGDQNFTYAFKYNADGTQASVTGQGEGASGSSFSAYDVNQRLTELNLGQSGNQDSLEFKTFTYNNDGQILSRFHDDGKNGTANVTTEYLYANGNPAAEVDDQGRMEVDEGRYDPIKIINADFPAASVIDYVVRGGDTLQSIAAQIYGNPSLWFVIAEANGLGGAEQLREGTHLKIPNTAQNGGITAGTHTLYNEGEIVGSTLPNLKAPPPAQSAQQSSGGDNCAVIGAIILVVLVAIVAIALTIVTAGVLAPAAAAAIGATSAAAVAAVTIGVTAVAGAVIGFAASAASQGIQIGFGLQQEFDWKQVAIDTVAGFVGGAVGGLGQVAATAVKAAQLGVNATRIARVGVVAGEAAAEVGIEAASQAASNEGRIEQPWMFGAAVGGVVVGELLSKGIKAAGARFRGTGNAAQEGDAAAAPTSGKKVSFVEPDGSIVTTSVGQAAAKPKDVTTPLKATDMQLVQGSAAGSLGLKIKDPAEVFAANGKKPSWKPTSWTDIAGSLLTMVQSPTKHNYAAQYKVLKSANLLNVGQWSKFDPKTVADFVAGTVGKVKNNKIQIDELPGLQAVGAKKLLTGASLAQQFQAEGKIIKPDPAVNLDLIPGVKVTQLDAPDLVLPPLGSAIPSIPKGLGAGLPVKTTAFDVGQQLAAAKLGGAPVKNGGNKAALGAVDLGSAKLGGAPVIGGNKAGLDAVELGGAKLGGAGLGAIELGGAKLGGAGLGASELGGAKLGGKPVKIGGSNAALGSIELGGAKLGGPPVKIGGVNNTQTLNDPATHPNDKMKLLLAAPPATGAVVNTPKLLTDYNKITLHQIDALRDKFKAELDNVTSDPQPGRYQRLKYDVQAELGPWTRSNPKLAADWDVLVPEEQVAIRGYTDDAGFPGGRSDYAELNKALYTYDNAAQKKLFPYLATLSSALKRLPVDAEGTVYRGANKLPAATLDRYKQPGAIVTEPTFFSSTQDFGTAFEGDTVFVTNMRTGRFVSPASAAGPFESEVLSIPGKKFKVLRFEDHKAPTRIDGGGKSDRQYVIYLDEVK